MRSLPQLLGALSLILWTPTCYAQGITLEGGASYERSNAENFDLERIRTRGMFLQRIKTDRMRIPLFVGLEIEAFEQRVLEDKTSPTLVPYETKSLVGTLYGGFELEEERLFSWRTLVGVSLQFSEAFEESFFLGGAKLNSRLHLNIYDGGNYQTKYYLDLQAVGRLGTDSSHASGVAHTGLALDLSKTFRFEFIWGGGARASFFVENLGINSGLAKFNVQVDVSLVAAEVFFQIWKFRLSGYHSPSFAGRYTSQSHLGVANNGGAEHSGVTLELRLFF